MLVATEWEKEHALSLAIKEVLSLQDLPFESRQWLTSKLNRTLANIDKFYEEKI